jgi:ankyrin repeat protein
MHSRSQIVFISSSRDMAEWSSLTSAHVQNFARRHGLSNLETLDYRDIDPADIDHAATWQESVGAPSQAEVVLAIVLLGERLGTPLPASFRLKQDIHRRLVRAGYDWVHVAGTSPHPLQPAEVPLTGVLFEFFDAFLPREDGTPSAPLRVIFKARPNGLDEPNFGNGDLRAKIESLPIPPHEKRQLRNEYEQQLGWMNSFWSRIYGLQQHATLFCPDQKTLTGNLERIFSGIFTAQPLIDPSDTQLPGPGSYDLERAMFFLGRGPQIAQLSQRSLMLDTLRQLVAVTGESGTGKSSLLRAGLMNSALSPSQKRLGWRSAFLSLSERQQNQSPIQFLATALSDHAALPELGAATALCQRLETTPEDAAQRLLNIMAETSVDGPLGAGPPKLLIIVDQVELAIDGARLETPESALTWKAFLQVLGALGNALTDRAALRPLDDQAQQLSARLPCSVVLGLPADRSDMLSGILETADRVFPVPRIVDETAIREIITGTFRALRLTIDAKARETLCREAVNLALGTDASILPLLAVTLSSLHEEWKNRRETELRRQEEIRKSVKFPAIGLVLEDKKSEPRADIELEHVLGSGRLDQSIEKLGELAWHDVSKEEVTAVMRSSLEDLPISAPRNRAKAGEITMPDFALPWLLRHLVVVSADDNTPDRLVGLPDGALEAVTRPLAEAMRKHRLLTRHDDGTWWLVHQSVLKSWHRAAEWREAEIPIHRTMIDMDWHFRRWKEATAAEDADANRWLWMQERDVEKALEWLRLCGREGNPNLFHFAKAGMHAAVERDKARAGLIVRASCFFNDFEWLEEILRSLGGSSGEGVNSLNREGSSSPLSLASHYGNAALVRMLLEAGALPNLKLAKGRTALTAAASAGANEVCDALLDAGAAVNHATEDGWTALMGATEKGHVEVVDRLLAAGADVNHLSDTGVSALFLAALNGQDVAVSRLLWAGATPDNAGVDGFTPLAAAAENGHYDIVDLLIAAGADVNCIFRDGGSALLLAARNGHDRVIDRLLNAGAEVNHIAKGDLGDASPYAGLRGHMISSAPFSLTSSFGVNVSTNTGTTALFWAAFNGHDRVVDRLLTAGANVSHVTDEGWTLLTAATKGGHQAVIQRLLEAGANIHYISELGSTALCQAVKSGREEGVRILLDNGAEVNQRTEGGQTPLMLASIDRDERIAALLLQYGADVSPRDQFGRNAIDIAFIQDSASITRMLLDAGASPIPESEMVKLRGQHLDMNIGLVFNARGKMCMVHDKPFASAPVWVGYQMDRRQIEINFDIGPSYPIDWEATDEMDNYLQRINKILIIRMVGERPFEGYDTSLLHLKNGKAIELE